MKLRKEGAPQYLSVAAAAREIGIAPSSLRWLEDRGVVTPLRFKDTSRTIRLFTEQNIQTVIDHYRRNGGVQSERYRRSHEKG